MTSSDMSFDQWRRFLVIEGCDYENCPPGGQLNFARQLVGQYRREVALVGVTSDPALAIGRWGVKIVAGVAVPFLPFRRRSCGGERSLVPERLKDYLALRKHRDAILATPMRDVFIQSPEVLMAVSGWGWKSLCYLFSGVENPLAMSRYRWSGLVARAFDRRFFHALQTAEPILAAADREAIEELTRRGAGLLSGAGITSFPTRVDNEVFRPKSRQVVEQALGIVDGAPLLLCCGRISREKGWELILAAFAHFLPDHPGSRLCFVGDGEDRAALQAAIAKRGLSRQAWIVGLQSPDAVSDWMNRADLVISGSYREGWPTVVLEALACGKAVVSTRVSGIGDMIMEGENGYIVTSRNPREFAEAMRRALRLRDPATISQSIASRYALTSLKRDLDRLWLRAG